MDVQVVALFIQNYLYPDKCARQAFQLLDAMTAAIEQNAAAVELARTGADIERIFAAGRIAMPLAIEGGHVIEDRLDLLRTFHDRGVSSMTLAHNSATAGPTRARGSPGGTASTSSAGRSSRR